MSERFRNVSLHVSPPPRPLLVTEKTTRARAMPRPPLDPVTNVGPRDLTNSVPSDRSPTAHPATCADVLALSPTSSPLELVHNRLQSCATSPSRRRPQSRRQSSISYLPPDSPRLWTPRTPQTGPDSLEHSSPLPSANNANKEGHVRARSIPQRAISEPVVLTLAERCVPRSIFTTASIHGATKYIFQNRYADLLQFIAQKESKCLELRSQLAVHESELLEHKRTWERIVRREFGRNIPSTSTTAAPATVLNGLVGGVRALAAVTTSPPLTPSLSRVRPSSSAFANHEPRQAASNSVSSTTTSSSVPSAADSPRLSQSSMSSVAEVKTDSGKVEGPLEEDVVRESGGTLASELSLKSTLVAQHRSSTLSEKQQSPSSKTLRRRSRDSQATLVDALKPLTGEGSHSGSGKWASAGAVSPTSASIPGMSPFGAMGLGRANLGEAAQGWVDSVGSRLAELQRGQT
jgi:hypothetical protein